MDKDQCAPLPFLCKTSFFLLLLLLLLIVVVVVVVVVVVGERSGAVG